jgi:hypothetical protein
MLSNAMALKKTDPQPTKTDASFPRVLLLGHFNQNAFREIQATQTETMTVTTVQSCICFSVQPGHLLESVVISTMAVAAKRAEQIAEVILNTLLEEPVSES